MFQQNETKNGRFLLTTIRKFDFRQIDGVGGTVRPLATAAQMFGMWTAS